MPTTGLLRVASQGHGAIAARPNRRGRSLATDGFLRWPSLSDRHDPHDGGGAGCDQRRSSSAASYTCYWDKGVPEAWR